MLDNTKKVLDLLSENDFFSKYDVRFVGGTALSYLLNHRLSEDLDFAMLGRIETDDIELMMNSYGAKKIEHDKYMLDRATNEGEDVNTYYLKYMLNGVKVEFFSPPFNILEKGIWQKEDTLKYLDTHIKIASLRTIMYMKSMAFWNRHKIRDLYDIYFAIENHYYSIDDFLGLYKKYNITYTTKNLLENIQDKNQFYLQKDDEGLFGLVESPNSYEWYRSKIEKFIYQNYLDEIYSK